MRVLLLTQHFLPEVTAGRFRVEPFVVELVRRGHQVQVICAVPNHPEGVIEEGYRGKAHQRRQVLGADVDYVWVLTTRRKTLFSRIGFYGSYAAMASAIGLRVERPDVILASSPPLPVGAAGATLARRWRVPWVLDVRDVWPDAAIALGELSEGPLVSLAERLERRLYRSADAIVTVNEAFREQIAQGADAGARIELIPNGTTEAWLEAGKQTPDRASLGLPEDRFIWAYAGNIGLAHGLETAVEAAGLLGERFLLLIIGAGTKRAEIERLAELAPNGSVELRALMPAAEAARHLRAADALLVSERQERTVASKLYDYGAVGRPVIAACRGELQRVVERDDVAVAVPHGDAAELAAAVRSLRADPARGEELVQRGVAFAREHLRETQAARLAGLLESVAAGG
ncbi:MAG TPA: glycosyltransferase family 4 protein [Polyangia bacterium]|nr:glycosyltransferase family 4 protein [Polyangia bacterium]